MSPGDFLRSVWPSNGIYCVATPYVLPDGKHTYAHKVVEDISEAVSYVLQQKNSQDVYFAVHTLKEKNVWDENKYNHKTGTHGAPAVRVQRNMAAAKCFFFDIDVGEAVDKYSSQQEAITALIAFCRTCRLPRPLVTSSGGGLHVYWLIGEELESEEWRTHAAKLKQLARHYGLKIDVMRTTDTSSVLRVAGTSNWKDRSNPRPVEVLPTKHQVTPTGVFIKALDVAIIEAGVEFKPPVKFDPLSILGNNMTREFDGPPVTLRAVTQACKQMARLAMAGGKVSEPEWYHGIIGVGRFTKDGHRRVHQMSQGHPNYTEASCNEKISQHVDRRDAAGNALGPTSCAKLAEISGAGDELCIGCPHLGHVQGPIGAARFHDKAPPPVVEELLGADVVVTEVPQAPEPFIRMTGGGVGIKAKNKDGDESYTTIYPYDLYPVRRLVNSGAGIEQQLWHVELPRGDTKEFILDADALYDSRKFMVAIAHQGIYPNKGHINYLQDYMVAYISELQRLTDADAQCGHLGWTDEYTRFIFPDKIIDNEGQARPAMLSLGAQRASLNVHKRGDMQRQIELLKFYDDPAYLPNQFYILAGLGAPIFHMTGHHGVIVNASGDAGASKSTSLYTAASFWGQPELYPINGTNNGATVRGRNERVTVLANLPICVDEITHMAVKDAVDLAMSITQPGHRIRLQNDGVERASIESYKATIMLTTANNSLHGLLSEHNAAGTAGSMRVFEIAFARGKVHKKHQADDYLHDLKENFGHIGEAFIIYVLKHYDEVKARVRAWVKKIDELAKIDSSERYWSAAIATDLVSCEIANELGLLSFDPKRLLRWILDEQIPYMRGVVETEYSDPMSVIADYLETISANIIVMRRDRNVTLGANISTVIHHPRGPLLAHYDITDHMLYVLKKGFKDHCSKVGANSTKILNDLHDGSATTAKIVATPHTRRTLGAGSEYAKAQTWCFAINMSHPEVSGAIDLEVITGGKQTGDDPPGLHAVQ